MRPSLCRGRLLTADDLLNVLDGFLRRADGIIDRLADYLPTPPDATTRNPQRATRYDDTLACQLER